MRSTCVPAPQQPSIDSPKLWKPRAYMTKAVKYLINHGSAGLLLDPGLGKTSITLAAIKSLKDSHVISKVLIIAPLRVCHLVWPKERDKWTNFGGLRMVVLHGPNKDQLLAEDADIYVINPEGLEWLLDVKKVRLPNKKVKITIDTHRWSKFRFDLLVIDELSKFKHTNTNRFKMMKLILHTFRKRWGLTGSPVANGLMYLFGQCYMLDMGRALGRYVTHYRLKYFQPVDPQQFKWVLRDGADQEIYKAIAPLTLRMAAEDYIDMPELVSNTIKVQLPPKVMKIYQQMEYDLIAKIQKNVVVAQNAGVASGKCRQIANGGLYLDADVVCAGLRLPKTSRGWVNLHEEKLNALEDLIDELQGAPLLVAYEFRHDLERLFERFGYDVPYIGAGVSTAKTKEIEAAWNKGHIQLLFGHPQSMSHGLNLQECANHIAWHSLTWDYELYDQFVRRLRRQGNTASQVFSHHFITEDTIDEVIMQTIWRKEKGQETFFRNLQLFANTRHNL